MTDLAVRPDTTPAEPPAPQTSFLERVRNKQDYLLSIPTYAILLALVVLPLGYLLYATLQSASPGAPNSEWTLDNLKALVTQPSYWTALRNSLWLGFLVATFAVVLGVSFAWILGRTDVPFRRVLSILVPLPIFLSPFACAIAWVLLGSENSGLINAGLRSVFGESAGIVNIMTFPGLVFVMVLSFAPLAYLFTLGPMVNMDGSLEEASRVIGASLPHTFFKVTLPVVIPGVLSAALMVFVLAAEMFSIPGLIGTAAGYRTLTYFIYQNTTTTPPNWGGAAVAGLALLVIMMLGMILQAKATRASARFVTISGKGSKPITMKLGKWRWFVFALPATYVLLAVILPAGALLIGSSMRYFTPELNFDLFTLAHWQSAFEASQFQTAMKNTILVGAVAPTIAVAFAFVMAYVRNRTNAPLREFFETVGMMPVAVPGIVFGVGVLWAYVGSPVYGTVFLLMIAYCARYLPHALRVISSGMVQIDKGLEEASRVAGAGVTRTLAGVTIPLLKPAALSSWLLLVIYCTRELNVAIMVYTSKSVVLPVLMWSEMSAGSYQKAAIIAIVESLLILAIVIVGAVGFRVDLTRR